MARDTADLLVVLDLDETLLHASEAPLARDAEAEDAGGVPRSRIVFVDDSPEKITRSYGNLIRVTPFEGDPDDRELSLLTRYLDEMIAPAADVREIEKRGWQTRVRDA